MKVRVCKNINISKVQINNSKVIRTLTKPSLYYPKQNNKIVDDMIINLERSIKELEQNMIMTYFGIKKK